MAKSLSIIFVSFIFSTNVSFGEDVCSHYEDKDCIHPNILKNGHFVNQWTVYLPEMTKSEAKQLLEENGFDYLGQIMDGVALHLVTKKGTHEKHALPNKRIIELLKKHKKVHSVAQKHVLDNSQEQVINIINEDRVQFESLDPNTIILNDGIDNLERITAFEAAEAAAAESDSMKSADNNNAFEADGGKNHVSVSDPNDSVEIDLSKEDLLISDLSTERLTDEEPSVEEILDKDALNEDALDEDDLDDDALDEDDLDDDALDEDDLDDDAWDENSVEKESSDETKKGVNG